MRQPPSTKQSHFDRLMADYRARVYETFLNTNQPAMDLSQLPTEALTQDPASTLLVVEDNADQWLMTQLALQQQYGKAKLVWVTDGEAAAGYLQACQSSPNQLPYMILIDLYLPTSQQGLHLLRRLKSHPLYRAIPTIMLSWSNHPADIQAALDGSADGYLVKPSRYLEWPQALRMLDSFWRRRTLA